jgi:hypothetical protein
VIQRTYAEVPMHDGRVTRTTILRDEDTTEWPKRQALMELVNAIAVNGALIMCGPVPPDTLEIRHDGRAWVATATAVTKG